MSQVLRNFILTTIREEKAQNAQLMSRHSPTEKIILDAIDSGAFQIREIAAETGFPRALVEMTLSNLLTAGILQAREQGGKTAVARGERKILYSRI